MSQRYYTDQKIAFARMVFFALMFFVGITSLAVQAHGPAARREKVQPFVVVLSSVEMTADGVLLGSRVYEAQDGSRADITYGNFPSAELARAQLHLWLKSALAITKTEERRNPSGKLIGERVVATFRDASGRKEIVKIVWTDESKCYRIGSTSRDAALRLEKWLAEP